MVHLERIDLVAYNLEPKTCREYRNVLLQFIIYYEESKLEINGLQ